MSEENSPSSSRKKHSDPLGRLSDLSSGSSFGSPGGSPRLLPRRTRPQLVINPSSGSNSLVEGMLSIDSGLSEDSPNLGRSDSTNQTSYWQHKCLNLQLELHRARHHAKQVQDVLQEQVAELQQKLAEAEDRAMEAETKLRLLGRGGESEESLEAQLIITRLENQLEEQRRLRLADARQTEIKAANLRECVTSKLRALEEQNQLLKEQNNKANEEIQLLRAKINLLTNRLSDGSQFSLSRDLTADHLQATCDSRSSRLSQDLHEQGDDFTFVPEGAGDELTHDYAEIYTPSKEKLPWRDLASSTVCGSPKPPTPPLHRYPSWESKLYQIAATGFSLSPQQNGNSTNSLPFDRAKQTFNTHQHNSLPHNITLSSSLKNSPLLNSDAHSSSNDKQFLFGEANVPVYASVKGRVSQIRSVPFSGESSDDSSDGEDHSQANLDYSHSNLDQSQNNNNNNNLASEITTRGSSSEDTLSAKTCSLSPSKNRDISFASGMSEDYAVPPDALSGCLSQRSSTHEGLSRSEHSQDGFEKAGHLTKLGGKLKTWRRRWFVLRNGVLTYWKSQNEISRKPRGEIHLDDSTKVHRTDQSSATFEIQSGRRTFYLTAESPAQTEDWLRCLMAAQRRQAARQALNRSDSNKPTLQGWLTKVKNGRSRKCWCVLVGRMFLYFNQPGDKNPAGEINMREARVEEVEPGTGSDNEDNERESFDYTIGIFPQFSGPSYLIFPTKQDKDSWLYHLTIVSGASNSSGTQFEQLVQKLMENDGDPQCVLWRHPMLYYTKEGINAPLTTLPNESLHAEAVKLFKACQLFMSAALDQAGIDYHVILAQNALNMCLEQPELQAELIVGLIKQTSRPPVHKQGVQGCQGGVSGDPAVTTAASTIKGGPSLQQLTQGWQLLALACSLFLPKDNRLLWFLKGHIQRHSDSKTECGKYAAYTDRAVIRTLQNGGRQYKPSRMEVLSILLKNPYHHSLPHAIPVHLLNGAYQVVSFDGSTTVEEFLSTLCAEIGCRESSSNGFSLYSDDPIERGLMHFLQMDSKVCDVISKWETALREKGSGKFENSRVIQLVYKNRLYIKQFCRTETEKERVLLCYQTNHQLIHGRFPLTKELALELAALMAQIEYGEYSAERSQGRSQVNLPWTALDRFYPYRYRDNLPQHRLKELQDELVEKWQALKGRTVPDCVRIYLTCVRKWPFFGASLFQAKWKNDEENGQMVWLAVAEDAVSILDLQTMAPQVRHAYTDIVTFGGYQDDLMLVVNPSIKLLFALSKPKVSELTALVADYMNAMGRPPGTPNLGSLGRNSSRRHQPDIIRSTDHS